MLGRILLQQVLEVWATGTENHLVSLGVLALSGDGHVAEGLLISEVLEGRHHVGLEVVPSQTKLLLVVHFQFVSFNFERIESVSVFSASVSDKQSLGNINISALPLVAKLSTVAHFIITFSGHPTYKVTLFFNHYGILTNK